MTSRQVYEAVLIEMNKVEAPSLLLEDFNYLFNKAINLYINKRYNIYDINLQTTDDLRVLKATALLEPFKVNYGSAAGIVTAFNSLQGATYEVELPTDYLHILNCICIYKVNKTFKCYDKDTYMQFPAKRLTSDAWSLVINNWYGRPSYRNPYYFLNHVNPITNTGFSSPQIATNPITDTNPFAEDSNKNGGLKYGTDGGALTIGDMWENYKYSKSMSQSSNSPYWDVEITNTGIYKVSISQTEADPIINYIIWDNKNKEFGLIPVTYISINTTGGKTKVIDQTNGEYVLTLNNLGHASVQGTILVIENANDVIGTYTLVNDAFLALHSEDYVSKGLPKEIDLSSTSVDLVERPAVNRYGNASRVRLEVRYGKDSSLFELQGVQVDYLKAPQFIRLTQEQLDLTEDTSQMMEFPDYVCQEIINELVHIVMENSGDPRVQTHPVVSQSIANPAQQLAQTQQAAAQ